MVSMCVRFGGENSRIGEVKVAPGIRVVKWNGRIGVVNGDVAVIVVVDGVWSKVKVDSESGS